MQDSGVPTLDADRMAAALHVTNGDCTDLQELAWRNGFWCGSTCYTKDRCPPNAAR